MAGLGRGGFADCEGLSGKANERLDEPPFYVSIQLCVGFTVLNFNFRKRRSARTTIIRLPQGSYCSGESDLCECGVIPARHPAQPNL